VPHARSCRSSDPLSRRDQRSNPQLVPVQEDFVAREEGSQSPATASSAPLQRGQTGASDHLLPRSVSLNGRESVARLSTLVVLIASLGMLIRSYPLGPTLIGVALAVWALLVWRVPKLSVPLLLGALPVANLAPLTGWLFINEFDMLVLATLAVRLI